VTHIDATEDPARRRGPLSRALALVWAAIYAIGLVSSVLGGHPLWVWVVSGVALLGWVVRALAPPRPVPLRVGAELVMIVAGGVSCVPGDVLTGVPLVVAIILTLGSPERPLRTGVIAVTLGAVSIGAGIAVMPPSSLAGLQGRLLGAAAVLVIGTLVAVNRRQSRIAERRRRELAAERLRVERLDDHASVARELHDVLAHGLGGLVIQLDAVDALLESGRVGEAAARVGSARRLAADAMGDARRAVDALRRDDRAGRPVAAGDLIAGLAELADAHRGLGGQVDARFDAGEEPIPAAQAEAMRRALQEALSNARKHAPGQGVRARLEERDGRLELVVTNPLGTADELGGSGGGHGLAGMRERFAELPGGTVEAGADGEAFTVHAGVSR
jgi:signal transduction histidine kinase